MKILAAALIVLAVASPVLAQSSRDRVDQALVIGGLSLSSIALGVTMACVQAGTCREGNPIMARWVDASSVKGPVIKSVTYGVAYYTVWRLTKGKTRTIWLASMAAISAVDAAHNIRQMGKVR